jgi:hypothetical protein
VAAQPPSEPRNPRRDTLLATCSASLLVFSNMLDLLLVRNRCCGHFPIGRPGWGFTVVRLLFLAGTGEKEVEMYFSCMGTSLFPAGWLMTAKSPTLIPSDDRALARRIVLEAVAIKVHRPALQGSAKARQNWTRAGSPFGGCGAQ